MEVKERVRAVRRPRDSAWAKISSGGCLPLPKTLSAASMLADSSSRAFSKRSVKSAMPVTDVTAITKAINSRRISPPRQSRHNNRKASPKRVENVLLLPLCAATASDTRRFLFSSASFLIAYHLTSD